MMRGPIGSYNPRRDHTCEAEGCIAIGAKGRNQRKGEENTEQRIANGKKGRERAKKIEGERQRGGGKEEREREREREIARCSVAVIIRPL